MATLIEVLDAHEVTRDIPARRWKKGGWVYLFTTGKTLYVEQLPEGAEKVIAGLDLVGMDERSPEFQMHTALMHAIERYHLKRGN